MNAQPWHFLIAKSPEAKKRISTATQGPFAYNEAKVLNANLVVVFCAKTDLDESYLQKITDQEAADGRFRSEEGKAEQHTKRAGYVGLHKNKLERSTAMDGQANLSKRRRVFAGRCGIGAGRCSHRRI